MIHLPVHARSYYKRTSMQEKTQKNKKTDMNKSLRDIAKIVVIISGKKYAGKDSVGEGVQKFFVSSTNELEAKFFKNFAFATQVREEYSRIKGVPVEDLLDRQKKERHREGVIIHGMFRRQQDPDYWYNHVETSISELFFEASNTDSVSFSGAVITDCRFPNELLKCRKFCRETGAFCLAIRVNASLKVRESRGCPMDFFLLNSDSETAMDHVQLAPENVLRKRFSELQSSFPEGHENKESYSSLYGYEPIDDYIPPPAPPPFPNEDLSEIFAEEHYEEDETWDIVIQNDFSTLEELYKLVEKELLQVLQM